MASHCRCCLRSILKINRVAQNLAADGPRRTISTIEAQEPLPPLKPITKHADIGCGQRSEQGEAEKEIGLDHGCLLLPRTTNGKTIVVPAVRVNHVVKVKLSYPFKQVQIAIEAVTNYAGRPRAAMEQKNYLFDELQNASVKLNDVKDDSIS
ncbi:hypothetical protein Tco_1442655, partial [Tanacetum coccineum]